MACRRHRFRLPLVSLSIPRTLREVQRIREKNCFPINSIVNYTQKKKEGKASLRIPIKITLGVSTVIKRKPNYI